MRTSIATTWPVRVCIVLLTAGFSACFSGCSEEWGAMAKPVVDVEGRVRVGATPVGGGWVEFIPVEGTVGDVRSARLRPDGSFRATKVARGRNVVRLEYPPAEPPVERIFRQYFSPVRRDVQPGQVLDIDLRRESLRLRGFSGDEDDADVANPRVSRTLRSADRLDRPT